jgi:hypothetical protein
MLTQQDIQLLQQIIDNALKNFATKDDLKIFATKEDLTIEMDKVREEMVTKYDFNTEIEKIRGEIVTKTEFEEKMRPMVTHADLQKAVDDIIDYTKTCFKISEEQFADHEKRIVKLEHQKVMLVNQ